MVKLILICCQRESYRNATHSCIGTARSLERYLNKCDLSKAGLWLIVGIASKAKQPIAKETSMTTYIQRLKAPSSKFGSERLMMPQTQEGMQRLILFNTEVCGSSGQANQTGKK